MISCLSSLKIENARPRGKGKKRCRLFHRGEGGGKKLKKGKRTLAPRVRASSYNMRGGKKKKGKGEKRDERGLICNYLTYW